MNGLIERDIQDPGGTTVLMKRQPERPQGGTMRGSSAYVLVQTETGATHIARRLQAVPGVVFAEDVRGPYDALALARSDGAAETLQTILDEIRSLPGVLRALAAPLVPAPVGVPSSDAA